MASDLREFIAAIDRAGELHRVTVPVSPHLEAAAIIDRVCKRPQGGHALHFAQIEGHVLPLVANLFGSSRRMALALGADVETLAERLRAGLRASGETNSVRALQQLIAPVAGQGPVLSLGTDDYLDATDEGLAMLPALQSWPGDGGRYLTLCQVYTTDPDSQVQNCGLYRVQVVDRHTALLRCHPGSGGARHLAAWHRKGCAMPVALALGGPPAMTWAASVSLPDGLDERDFVGFLVGEPVAGMRCHDVPLVVPARAEIILEGWIEPEEQQQEGPFGNHTGRYTDPAAAPVLRLERMTIRRDALYPCTVVGPPPMENINLARTTERLLLPLLQHDHPWVVDVHMPSETIFHRLAMVVLHRSCDLNVEAIAAALLSSSLLKGARALVLLDEGANPHDLSRVLWQVVNAPDRAPLAAGSCTTPVVDARLAKGAGRVMTTAAISTSITTRRRAFGLPD